MPLDPQLKMLTIQLQGHSFALRLDPELTVVPIPHLIRPPLLPPHLSGLALVEDRTLVLADLGACLGYPPMASRIGLQALLPEGGEAGFVLSGTIVETSCAAETLYPLPELLTSPLWEGCLLQGGTPIPVLSLQALHNLVHRQESDPAGYLHGASPDFAAQNPAYLTRLTIAGQPFALTEPEPVQAIATPSLTGLLALPGRPDCIVGLASFDRELLPLFDVRSAFGLDPKEILPEVLLWRRDGQLIGLWVDGGAQSLPATEPVELPPPAASALLRQAIVAGDTVLPLLDLPRLVAGEQVVPLPLPAPLTAREVPPMGEEPLAVLEVALRGNRLALPAEETGEPFPACCWQPLPTTHLLLAGVARHEDRLWPVLDLGGCFGQSAGKMTGLLMVPVTRNNFRALLLVEEHFGRRLLAPEEQRVLPVAVPGHIVHGCYLGAQSVHLIVDVAALCALIEPVEIRTMQRFFDDYWTAPETTVPETTAEAPAPATVPPPEIEPQPVMAEPDEGFAPLAPAAAEAAGPAPAPPRAEEFRPVSTLPSGPEAQPLDFTPSDVTPKTLREALVPEAAKPPDSTLASDLPVAPEPSVVAAEPIVEAIILSATVYNAGDGTDEEPAAEPIAQAADNATDASATDQLPVAPDDDALAAASAELSEAAKTPVEQHFPAQIDDRGETGGDIDLSQLFIERETTVAAAEPAAAALAETQPPVAPPPPSAITADTADTDPFLQPPPPSPTLQPRSQQSRRWLAAAVILLVLGGAGFWLWQTTSDSLPEKTAAPAPSRTVASAVPPAPAPAQAQTPALRPTAQPAPLLVPVPPAQAVPTVATRTQPRPALDLAPALPGMEYQVRRGDTLWDISARYTGDPFTYPDLARKNRIDNPHLIFPGQTIRVPAAAESGAEGTKP